MSKQFKNSFVVTGSIPLLKAFVSEVNTLGYNSDEPWNRDHPLRDNMKYIEFIDGIYYYHNHNCSPNILYTLPNDWNKALKLASEVKEEVIKVPEYIKIVDPGWYIIGHSSIKGNPLIKGMICKVSSRKPQNIHYTKSLVLDVKDGYVEIGCNENETLFLKATKSEYDAQELEYKKQELLSEAKRRGYRLGTNIKPLWKSSQKTWDISDSGLIYHKEYYADFTDDDNVKYDILYFGDTPIYWNGKWAEIVKNEFKVGDWVIATINTFTQEEFEIEVGTVSQITDFSAQGELWLNCIPSGEGVANPEDFRLATPEEIAKVKEDTIEIAGYKAEVKGYQIAFGCKRFTRGDLEVIKRVMEISEKTGLNFNFESGENLQLTYDGNSYDISSKEIQILIDKISSF